LWTFDYIDINLDLNISGCTKKSQQKMPPPTLAENPEEKNRRGKLLGFYDYFLILSAMPK